MLPIKLICITNLCQNWRQHPKNYTDIIDIEAIEMLLSVSYVIYPLMYIYLTACSYSKK